MKRHIAQLTSLLAQHNISAPDVTSCVGQPSSAPSPPQGFTKMTLMSLQGVKEIELETNALAMRVSEDGKLYTVGQYDITVWEPSGKLVKRFKYTDGGGNFIFSTSTLLVVEDYYSIVMVFNKMNYSKMVEFRLNGCSANSMDVTETHCAVNNGGDVYVFDLDRLQEVKKLNLGPAGGLLIHQNHLFIGTDSEMRIVDMTTMEKVKSIPYDRRYGGPLLAQGDVLHVSGPEQITAFDLKTYKQVSSLTSIGGKPSSMVVSGNTMFTSISGGIKIWDLTKNGLVNTLESPSPAKEVAVWDHQLVSLEPQKKLLRIWGTK